MTKRRKWESKWGHLRLTREEVEVKEDRISEGNEAKHQEVLDGKIVTRE